MVKQSFLFCTCVHQERLWVLSIPLTRHCLVVGHIDCLSFLIENGCLLKDVAVSGAVREGHLKAVELLVSCGLPQRPFFPDHATPCFGRLTPNQLRCLEHLLDNGRHIHPAVVIWAATGGDLEAVRLLHSRGVPFWHSACEEDKWDREVRDRRRELHFAYRRDMLSRGIISVPETAEDTEDMRDALHYAWAMGAPLTPVMEELFDAKRAGTRATLLCFHVAMGLSQMAGSSSEQRDAWAGMGRVPLELIERILVDAEYEITDALRRSVLRDRSVKVDQLATAPWRILWMRKDGVLDV